MFQTENKMSQSTHIDIIQNYIIKYQLVFL